MARVPAICEKCHTLFPSGFNIAKGGTNTVFVGCIASPCPVCGSDGIILDGVYNAIGEAVEIFVGQQKIDSLKRLLGILESAKNDQLKHEEVIEKIKQSASEFSSLIDCLPKTRTELYAFLVLIIMVINTLLSSGKKVFDRHEIKQQVNTTVNNYENNIFNNNFYQADKVQSPRLPHKRIGRNEPCPCGSNKKYKKCCGKRHKD